MGVKGLSNRGWKINKPQKKEVKKKNDSGSYQYKILKVQLLKANHRKEVETWPELLTVLKGTASDLKYSWTKITKNEKNDTSTSHPCKSFNKTLFVSSQTYSPVSSGL